MSEPPADWALLAAAAIRRLQARAAEEAFAYAARREQRSAPQAQPASPSAALPDVLPDILDEDETAGDDELTGSDSAEFGYSVPLPTARLAAAIRLARTFRSPERVSRLLRPGTVTLLNGIRPEEAEPFSKAATALLPPECRVGTNAQATRGAATALILLAPEADAGTVPLREVAAFGRRLEEALDTSLPILALLPHGCRLPRELVSLLPAPTSLAPPDRETVLFHLRHSHPTAEQPEAELRRALPADAVLARLTPAALRLAFRGQTRLDVATRLSSVGPARSSDGPRLDDIRGYGEAAAVARRMTADLLAWSRGQVRWAEVTRSVIFHGPPGTGKTYLARAMGNEPGVTLIAASFGQWQAAGHLGHMLAAMHASFAEARAANPAILFIDEIDAVGSRSSRDHHGENYRRQVVNAFLELLDGAGEMEGTLVVGATNALGAIDGAILRPGRFDAIVEVPLPGEAALTSILRAHLHAEIPDADLPALARLASGRSAAAVEAAIRQVKCLARSERRPFALSDLRAELAPAAPERSGRDWRVAVHESGHAIVAVCLCRGHVDRVLITPGGGQLLRRRGPGEELLEEYENELAFLLAGRAAERLVLSTVSGGAGGGAECDLAKATQIAVGIEIGLGLGNEGPVWQSNAETAYLHDPTARARVRERLETAEQRALEELRRHKEALLGMARELDKRRVLEGDDLACWLERLP